MAYACGCLAYIQAMFHRATSFNQSVAAWDIGKVTNMVVRRRPGLEGPMACPWYLLLVAGQGHEISFVMHGGSGSECAVCACRQCSTALTHIPPD